MLSSLKSLASSSAIKAAYTINEDSGFVAGAWLVQDAIRKSTKQEVSVLTFSKKSLEQPLQRTSSSLRQSFDSIYAQLKTEAATLARLRHPAMLDVVEPIEESRNTIMFVTERVTACLSSMVADDDAESFSHRRHRGDTAKLDEVEIQKGLLQVTIGLEFLQSVAHMVHGNLVPASVLINSKGDWKLSGFSFAMSSNDSPRYMAPDYDNRLPQSVQRNLNFAAPEFVLDESIDPLNDMFSLGCLICALVSTKHRSIIDCNQNIHLYRKAIESLNPQSLPGMPPYLGEILPQLLTRRPANRLSAQAFQSSPFFDNILMNTIRFLDSFPEKTNSERQAFMKGLQSVIPQFPPRILTRKILPGLLDQFQDHALIPLILPNIFLIAEGMTQKVFSSLVLPKLKIIFTMTDIPSAIMFLLEKLNFMKSKMTSLELKEDGMSLVYTALTGNVQYLQEKALEISAEIVTDLDLITIKTALFPKIAEVFTHTTMLGTKVTALRTFDALVLNNLDKYTITEKLIPLIKGIKTKEPAVGLAAMTLSRSCGSKVDHETIALDILPQLWSMALGPLLSQSEFAAFMTTIKELSSKVEQEQGKKLLESGAPFGKSSHQATVDAGNLMQDESVPVEASFENLVLGTRGKSTNAHHYSIQSYQEAAPSDSRFAVSASSSARPMASFNWSTPLSNGSGTTAGHDTARTGSGTHSETRQSTMMPLASTASKSQSNLRGLQTHSIQPTPASTSADMLPKSTMNTPMFSHGLLSQASASNTVPQEGIDWTMARVQSSIGPPASTRSQQQLFQNSQPVGRLPPPPSATSHQSPAKQGGLASYQSLL